MIAADDIGMCYQSGKDANPTQILDSISFSVETGAFVTILGPSGCGKTTLIRILASLVQPTRGIIRVDGVNVKIPSHERTVIFQDYGLFEWKTVLENVEFGLKAKGLYEKERKRIAREYVKMVRLEGAEDKYPSELSGGMKQRAAIARAIAVEPKCLLMDEPFSALDSQTRSELQEEILEIWQQTHQTVVLVTHNIEEALFLSDRILLLSKTPSRIVMDLKVDFPRPRLQELRFESGFRELADKLWHALRNEVH
jgi:NitT/TauT family transport system ATP-binding protein